MDAVRAESTKLDELSVCPTDGLIGSLFSRDRLLAAVPAHVVHRHDELLIDCAARYMLDLDRGSGTTRCSRRSHGTDFVSTP